MCVCVCVCVNTEALEEDDDVPFTDKKKSKIKLPFSTKKMMKNVGLKEKDRPSKEKWSKEQAAAVSPQPVARAQHEPTAEVDAQMQDSEQWKAFQAMQERISQVVSQTSEKVSQMEQGFETELSKLTSSAVAAGQTSSPWSVHTTSPTADKSAADNEDHKNVSWVGFEDTFDGAAETADGVTALPDANEQQVDDLPVNSNQQVDSQAVQVCHVDDSSSSSALVPDDVIPPPPPPDNDVITCQSTEPETEPQLAAEAGSDDVTDDVAMVTNNTEAVEERTGAEHEEQRQFEPVAVTSDRAAEYTDSVDPFDVRNVVTAMTSGKPVCELLNSVQDTQQTTPTTTSTSSTVQQRRERDRQITAALIGADENEATGARSRPRPRPQAAVKSANPFKIALAATSIEPAVLDEDADDSYDVYYSQTTSTFSAANPFARTDVDESDTVNVDSGIWDPFSGADSTEFTATFDLDELADSTNYQSTKTRDKDADSHSSRSSFEEPDETLEPLDPFYPVWDGKGGWNMLLRTPLKKKLTQNRAWKPVFVKLCEEKEAVRIRIYTNESETTCLHEMTLGPTFTLRQMRLQQFDQYTKCHTVKLEHVFYVEKLAFKSHRIAPTLRDVTKVRDLKGLKDLVHKPKTTMLLSHSPQATESLKVGTLDLVAYKQFIRAVEDVLFALKGLQRGKMATSYTKDEITVDLVDEYYADIDSSGHISYHKARVRLFCLAFLTGNPVVEIGINDKKRRGNEVVARADIIPVKTEDWIKYEDVELHDIVDRDEYDKLRLIKCRPPDASRFEMMRFRVRPRVNVELPLQISVQMSAVERRIEIRADVMIPGYYSTSRRASQVACENIQIRFPIPESLVYMFRVEKRFRYGSVHSSKKKPGRIKGLERLAMLAGGSGANSAGTANAVPGSVPIVLQTSSGLAKYEHLYSAVVWRISRLPERNQGQSVSSLGRALQVYNYSVNRIS